MRKVLALEEAYELEGVEEKVQEKRRMQELEAR